MREEHSIARAGSVPFGRYLGQPLQVLLADRPYVTRLLEEPHLAHRYPDIWEACHEVRMIPTRDYMRLWTEDRAWRRACAILAAGGWSAICDTVEKERTDRIDRLFEQLATHVLAKGHIEDDPIRRALETDLALTRDEPATIEIGGLMLPHYALDARFSVYTTWLRPWTVKVICWPEVSDYPQVVSTVTTADADVLVIHTYQAPSLSLRDFRKLCRYRGVDVLLAAEIDEEKEQDACRRAPLEPPF
jgi:hypothetical protein